MMKKVLIAGFILLSNVSIGQTCSCVEKKVSESVWKPQENEYPKTVLKNSFMLVFQQEFDDSIKVYVANKLLIDGYFKTDPVTGIVPANNKIEKPLPENGSEVKIVLINKNECVEFKISNKYSYAYITRDEYGKWFVELSEYKRNYY